MRPNPNNVPMYSNYIMGTVTAYTVGTGAMTITVEKWAGSGTYGDGTSGQRWTIHKAWTYDLNDIVFFRGLFYKSKIANNTSNRPTGFSDANWDLIIFSNGSTMPPDDVRLPLDDFYYGLNIGLGIPAPSEF
jgi:hypothetical protein